MFDKTVIYKKVIICCLYSLRGTYQSNIGMKTIVVNFYLKLSLNHPFFSNLYK